MCLCVCVYVCVFSALTKLNWALMCVRVGVKQEGTRLCVQMCVYIAVIASKNTLTTVQSDTAVGVCACLRTQYCMCVLFMLRMLSLKIRKHALKGDRFLCVCVVVEERVRLNSGVRSSV